MPRILIIGHRGQVGHELSRLSLPFGDVITAGRDDQADVPIDLNSNHRIEQALAIAQPDWIINAAAYNAVDEAENNTDLAMQINCEAPSTIAQWAQQNGASFVHYSSDYVFDGRQDTPYTESDPATPLSAYGRSKLAGELAVLNSGVHGAVLRTSWVFNEYGQNFLNSMCHQLREKETLSIVDDQIGVPTWARQLAEWTIALLLQHDTHSNCTLLHANNSGQTSRYDFVDAIRDALIKRGEDNLATLQPIASRDFPHTANRPSYSVMNNRQLANRLGLNICRWQDALAQCLGVELEASNRIQ